MDIVTCAVEELSTVEKSVYCTLPPFQDAIICPALLFGPLYTVYCIVAAVKEPVDNVNKLLAPAIEEFTVE
jgi:hypothetical protein